MKIGIDGTPLSFENHGGIRHYTENLINALASLDKKNKYVIFSPKKIKIPNQDNFRLVTFPSFPPVFKRQRLLSQLVKKERVDVFHYPEPFGSIFFRHPKIVTTIHDVNLDITYQKFHNLRYLLKRYYCGITRFFVSRHTRQFIAVSQAISNEFKQYLRNINRRRKITVIYEAPAKEFALVKVNQVSHKKPLEYFLCFVDFPSRKNVKRILKAYSLLPESYRDRFNFILICTSLQYKIHFEKIIKEMGVSNNTKIFVGISNTRLAELYRSASALVYPSLYEGFGLPILEAMSCGCPVITSNRGALREIAGGSAILVDPESTEEIKNAMIYVVDNNKIRLKLVRQGLIHAAKFSWERTARETLEVYQKVYSER